MNRLFTDLQISLIRFADSPHSSTNIGHIFNCVSERSFGKKILQILEMKHKFKHQKLTSRYNTITTVQEG